MIRRLTLLVLVVGLAGCTGGASGPTPEPTVIVDVATVTPGTTSGPVTTAGTTPGGTPTATLGPDSSRLAVDGTVEEYDDRWEVTWAVTNEADRAGRYEFVLEHRLIGADGEERIVRSGTVDRTFDAGETTEFEWVYDKARWNERGWGDRGPYAVAIRILAVEGRP